jgi:hypothetical protein
MTTPGRAVKIVTFDLDLRHRSRFQFALQGGTDQLILDYQGAELAFGSVPLGSPFPINGNAETDWIGFLAHG